MMMVGGARVHVSDTRVGDERDAVQLIARAYYEHQAEWVAFTPEQLGDEFFELRTGRAGGIAQKFVYYRMGLAWSATSRAGRAEHAAGRLGAGEQPRPEPVVRADLDALAARLQAGSELSRSGVTHRPGG